jgi:hypothetical protein
VNSVLDEQEIDRQFAAMAEDADYQVFQIKVAESFAESDLEALAQADRILENLLDL